MCPSEVVVFDDHSLPVRLYNTHTWQCENRERYSTVSTQRVRLWDDGLAASVNCWNFSGERGAHTSSSIHCCELMGPAPTKKMTRHDQHILPSKVSIIIAPIRRRTLAASTRLIAWKNILFTFSYTPPPPATPTTSEAGENVYYLLLFEHSSSLFLSSWWSMGTGNFASKGKILLLTHPRHENAIYHHLISL